MAAMSALLAERDVWWPWPKRASFPKIEKGICQARQREKIQGEFHDAMPSATHGRLSIAIT